MAKYFVSRKETRGCGRVGGRVWAGRWTGVGG